MAEEDFVYPVFTKNKGTNLSVPQCLCIDRISTLGYPNVAGIGIDLQLAHTAADRARGLC